ncbi:fibronectin type III domain-containing protein [Homoserinimonas sp. OAct 916]|uniref:fibronectin type III domain-containing protein n=1 Tax=Homoserinimonas sp. OAct 916 TaxID=2211450 RepID=UPI000DBEA46C|nr:fibronectin type III domain-containing protein [Homoserinimonas sp. OAct 916]
MTKDFPSTKTSLRDPHMEQRRRRWLRRVLLFVAITVAGTVGTILAYPWGKAAYAAVATASHTTDVHTTASYETLDAEWAAAENAASYSFLVATDSAMSDVVWSEVNTEPHARAEGLSNGNEYWYQVNSFNALGFAGEATTPQSVTTQFRPVDPPVGLKVTPLSPTSVRVTWKPATWATGYTVTQSTDKAEPMRGVEHEATLSAVTIEDLPVEKYGRDYFFSVQSKNGENLSPPSATAVGNTFPTKPAAVTLSGRSSLGVTVAWQPSMNAQEYVVERASDEFFIHPENEYRVPLAYTRLTVNDLSPGAISYFRVRAVNGDASVLGDAVVTAQASDAATIPLQVASYNVRSTRYDPEGQPWKSRRSRVAELINAAKLDVIGLQEASAVVRGPAGARSQVDDLASLTKPRLTKSKAAHLGTSILYDAKKFEPVRHGVINLAYVPGDTSTRAAVWQEMRDKKSKARFLVVNAHLSNGPGADRNKARFNQSQAIIEALKKINPGGMPVVLTGDLNTFDSRAEKTPLNMFSEMGLARTDLSAARTTNNEFNSLSRFGGSDGSERGTKLDYILASEDIGVEQFTVVLDTTASGKLRANEASDHRPVVAHLRMPVVK